MQNTNKGLQYTFDGFEVTKINQKALDLAMKFAKDETARPLAIFGGCACGKTHLLYAVKNAIERNSPEIKVVTTTAVEIQSSLVNIINDGGSVQQFREQYMSADALLVDDVQELAGKESIQDGLILIFNTFFESGKRFMMTSSQKAEQYGMNARLVCRSFWGDFAVISRSYVNAKFENDPEREEKRTDVLESSKHIYRILSLDKDFILEEFQSYFKAVWMYFMQYIGVYDIDRQDVKIINYLNRIVALMEYKNPVGIKNCEHHACILFLKSLIYTLTSHERDIRMYRGGFYENGVLYVPMPHTAGTSDCHEITIDEFERYFNHFCNNFFDNNAHMNRFRLKYLRFYE